MNIIPAFGLGTYRLKGQTVTDAVNTALELGYPLIDTAQIYDNEKEIGQAIANSSTRRERVFLTTKIWIDNLNKARLIPSLQESLKKLHTDYVDLTLIHWPSPQGAVAVTEYISALMEAKTQGLTRFIGVSNFPVALMQEAITVAGPREIAACQIELHPYLQNQKVVAFAQSNGIHITSYMTLGYGRILNDPVIQAIAERHHATPAQVALAWAMQLGYAVIPSSTQRRNLESNLNAQTLHLTDRDMQEIACLDRGERIANPAHLAPKWD